MGRELGCFIFSPFSISVGGVLDAHYDVIKMWLKCQNSTFASIAESIQCRLMKVVPNDSPT